MNLSLLLTAILSVPAGPAGVPASPAPILVGVAVVQDAELKALLRQAKSKDKATRTDAYERMIDLGFDGLDLLEPLLRDAEEKARREFLSLLKSGKASAFRKWLGKEIEKQRKEALAVIRDRKVYPDDAHGKVGQPVVDREVGELRRLWYEPGRVFIERVPEASEQLDRIRESWLYLRRGGFSSQVEESDLLGFEEDLAEVFDTRSIVFSRKERNEIEDLQEYNANAVSDATVEERRFVRILNDYRIMLGLKCMEMDDRLVVASRKHSQEMQDLNYFAHISPVEENRTPSMRASKEGYTGGPLENCAHAADAQGAFNGWYYSSGHHRGMIAERPSQLGAGHSVNQDGSPGRLWTMMAGSSNSLRGKKKKGNPRLTFLSRRDRLDPDDADGRYALARWCHRNEMPDEANELLAEAIGIDPEHDKAHRLLGHVRGDDGWISAEEKLKRDLADKGEAEVLDAVARQLRADEAPLRVAAVRILGGFDHPKAGKLLVGALKDGASEVRTAACDALAQTGSGAVGPLKGMLRDRSFYVAHSAAAALWRLGDRAGADRLFQGLRSKDLNTRIDSHRKARGAFGRDFGYRWDLPDVKRALVVDEWEEWVSQQQPGQQTG